jgi:hypothetical protein
MRSNTTVKVNIQANGTSYFNGGNVGIGTTAPSYALHVSGTGEVSSRTFATDATGDASFFVQNDGNGICGPLVYGSTKTAYGALASTETAFYSNRSTTIMADGGSTVIKFATGGNTERARIDSSGRLLVGTSTALGTSTLVVQGIAGVTNAARINTSSAAANSFTMLIGKTRILSRCKQRMVPIQGRRYLVYTCRSTSVLHTLTGRLSTETAPDANACLAGIVSAQ